MKKYTIKRILTSLFTLLAILLVLFILMQLMPGSPFNDEKLTADMRAALYAKYGLDQPIYIQFFRYVGNMLRGDLGVSYNISKNTPISQLIQSRLPISIQIGGMAVTLGALVGLVLGIIAALKRDTIFDTIATILSVIGVSVPSYVFALALSYTFGFRLRWFPMLFSAKDVFGSSVLPSVSLSMFTMASIARFTRSEMIEVLDSDYMLLAESKGISGPALIFRHALRNALIPIITVLAPLIVDLMTGSLVVEKIFAIPGVGSLLVTAIQSNDYNVVIGLSFIYSAMYIGIMLWQKKRSDWAAKAPPQPSRRPCRNCTLSTSSPRQSLPGRTTRLRSRWIPTSRPRASGKTSASASSARRAPCWAS